MKNLKKILIVIAMLALLVSSLAIVIAAEEENVGSVEEIEEYIAKIEAELAKPEDDETRDPVSKVTGAYDYIRDPLLSWDGVADTPEYAAAVAKLDGLCIRVGQALCAKMEKVADVNAAYSFISKCDPSKETAGYAEIVAAITAKNEVFTEELFAAIVVPTIKIEPPAPETPAPEEPAPETPAPTTPASEEPAPADPEAPEEPEPFVPTPEQLNEAYVAIYSDVNSAREAAKKLFDQLAKCPWVSDAAATKYDEKAKELITLMLDAYYSFLGVADVQSNTDYFKLVNDIRTIEALVNDTVTFSKVSEDVMTKINNALKGAEEEIEKKRVALDNLAPFEEYDLGYYIQKYFEPDFQDTGEDLPEVNKKNAHYSMKSSETIFGYDKNTGKYGQKENSFTKFVYGPDEAIHLYTYLKLNGAFNMQDYGIVFEWDMRLNDRPGNAIVLQGEDRTRTENGSAVFVNLFNTITGSDNFVTLKQGSKQQNNNFGIVVLEEKDRKFVENAMVTDVWTHFAVTFNPETRVGTLYVNYVPVFEIYHFNADKLQTQFRLGPTATQGWEDGWDIDNIEMYYGTEFRITDKFSSMSRSEQFEYFVSYACGEMDNEKEYLSRNSAYTKAKLMMSESDKFNSATVAKFKELDAQYDTAIKLPAMEQNLTILTQKVAALNDDEALKKITTNKEKISKAIDEINAFVSKNGSLIDKADTSDVGYQAQMSVVYSIEARIAELDYIERFVEEVTKFERATTLSARTRYALAAAEIYAMAEYDFAEKREFIANDPVVEKFEKALNGQILEDGTEIKPGADGYLSKEDPAYKDIFEYYAEFEEILVNRERLENSKNIIKAMNTVTGMDGYVANDEFFAANYDEIKSYTLLVRQYINSDNYDKEYPGVSEAVEKFNEMDPYFFERLQLEHIEILTEMIAKYDASNVYIEKRAAVNAVKAYFENEDTALNNTTVTKAVRMRVEDERDILEKLQGQNDVYDIELIGYETSYPDVLKQQTKYFINIINHMDSVVDFSKIEELFAEASVYYYGITLDIDGALVAAEKYDDYRKYIASVNESNSEFSMYIKDLDYAANCSGAEKRDEMFRALKNLREYADFVDASNDGIARQLEKYYNELAAYENGITAVENAIYEANQFANAIRTNKLPATVLSVIGKLIKN